jgi:hypothetical protein
MSLLVEVMRRLSEVARLNEALKKYSECLDVKTAVPSVGIYISDEGGVVCDIDNCTVDTRYGSFLVLPDGRVMVRNRKWAWLMTTEELDLLFECIKQLRSKIEERIRELDEKIEEMKTLLAEATLLCP